MKILEKLNLAVLSSWARPQIVTNLFKFHFSNSHNISNMRQRKDKQSFKVSNVGGCGKSADSNFLQLSVVNFLKCTELVLIELKVRAIS